MEAIEARSCKSCTQHYQGRFCPECGQKYIEQRITVKESISHLFQTLFNLDRGLWPTAWHLLVKPGEVVRSYLSGITIRYSHPFRFLFLWLTLQVFFLLSTGTTETIQHEMGMQFSGDAGMKPEMAPLMQGFNSYMHLIITASMPFLAAGSLLFFRSSKLNYAEHIVIATFLYGEVVLIGLLASFSIWLFYSEVGMSVNISITLITLGYLAYAYTSVFSGNMFLNFLKTIGIFLIWFIGFILVLLIIAVPYVVYLVHQKGDV